MGRDGFQCHVASTLNGPFVVLLEQDCPDKTNDRVFVVGEEAFKTEMGTGVFPSCSMNRYRTENRFWHGPREQWSPATRLPW